MAEILMFHHGHGVTDRVRHFAERLRREGHVGHVPDLYEGRVFESLADGPAYAQSAGDIMERGVRAADARC